MTLYEKHISPAGKVACREHIPAPVVMPEIESAQVVTLLSALTISMLMSVSEQLPPHAALARRVRGVEDAIKALAQLNGTPLDPQLIEVGVAAWNSAIHSMQSGLAECEGGK